MALYLHRLIHKTYIILGRIPSLDKSKLLNRYTSIKMTFHKHFIDIS